MATVNLYNYFTVSIDNVTYKAGSLSTAQTLTAADGVIFDQTYKISSTSGPSVTTEIWTDDLMTGASTDFDFLWIQSDQDAKIQLVASEDVSDQLGFVVNLKANIPYVLVEDLSSDLSGGTDMTNIDTWEANWDLAATIDRIEYTQSSGSDAKVRVIAIT